MKLKDYLLEKNISPMEFAIKVKCSVSTIYNVITGTHYPRASIRKRIKDASKGKVSEFEEPPQKENKQRKYEFHMPPPSDLMTTQEAAQEAKVGIAAIYQAIYKGRLKAQRLQGDRRIFVDRKDLEEYRLWKYSRVPIDNSKYDKNSVYSVTQVSILLSDDLKISLPPSTIHSYIRRGLLPARKEKNAYIISYADMMKLKDMFVEEIRYRRSLRNVST